jgi:hypothetical protein
MHSITMIWTALAVGFAGLAAGGGGHPPGIILVPFVFVAWLVGAVALEAIARWRDPRRSLRRSFVFVTTAGILFLGVPVTVLMMKDYPRSLDLSNKTTLWYLGLGPFLLIATAASLWELTRSRQWLPLALLVAISILLLRFAWQNEWLPSTVTAIVAAAIQLYAATLLASGVPTGGDKPPRPDAR